MKLVSIYLTSFYGSNLWDLFGDSAERLYSSWNIMVRYCYDIPRTSHRYLIEPISGTTHLKVKLIKRFNQFYKTLFTCDRPNLKYLANLQKSDYRSTFGRNVRNICLDSKVENISDVDISDVSYVSVPDEEEWRIPLVKELLEIRAGRLLSILTEKELEKLIFAVTSI